MLKITSEHGTELYIDTDNHWFMRVPVEQNPDHDMDRYYPPNERINYGPMHPKEPLVGGVVRLYDHFSSWYQSGTIVSIEKDQ